MDEARPELQSQDQFHVAAPQSERTSVEGRGDVPSAAALVLATRLRELACGTVEWRVADPVTGAYCISFGYGTSFSPERDAREWLEDHKRRHPGSMHADKEVREVRYFTELERAALEAADFIAGRRDGSPAS